MFPRRAFALLLCVVGGAAGALLLMPRIVRGSHDDTSRLCAILDACHASHAPPLVLLGNSAGMFGVDTRPLGGWNFCSPAQTLAEGLLLQQALPNNVKVVVQLVTQSQLSTGFPIDPDHINAMQLCGFTATHETREVLARVYGEPVARQAEASPLAARVAGRRHVRAAIEGLARDVLRGDSARLRLAHDLYFPAGHGSDGSMAERRFADLDGERFDVRESHLRLLRESAALAARAGRRYVVVLAPIHPRLGTNSLACPPELDCVDLTRLLDASEFQDPMHASPAGARKLTRAIRDALTARRLLSER